MSASSSSELSSTSRPTESGSAWASRIRVIQMEKCTPVLRQQIEESSERKRHAKTAAKACSRLERVNYMSSASNVSALSSWAVGGRGDPEEYSTRSAMQSVQSERLRSIMSSTIENASKRRSASVRTRQFSPEAEEAAAAPMLDCFAVNDEEDEDEEDENDHALDDLELQVQSTTATPILSSALALSAPPRAPAPQSVFATFGSARHADMAPPQPTIADELSRLLEQLAVEPTNEVELAAKFTLFENFLTTVTAVRDSAIQFWEENKLVFVEGQMRDAVQREISAIDSAAASTIVEDPRKWFVYFMLKKANENSAVISRLLASLRSRLELLAQEPGDCPICLECISAAECTTLSCIHKVCTGCWQQYSAMMAREHRQLVCPLCRHEEFLAQIVELADTE